MLESRVRGPPRFLAPTLQLAPSLQILKPCDIPENQYLNMEEGINENRVQKSVKKNQLGGRNFARD